jgi:hypothetical protein
MLIKKIFGKASSSRRAKGGDDLLCYMDQGSFVGLRALGHEPKGHFTWIYAQPLDPLAVEQFNMRLSAQPLLGRLVQRSPLPWGRHRWVDNPMVPPVTWFSEPISRDSLHAWCAALINLPVDPEHGPGWRLAVQPFQDGGCALSLLTSHTIVDGMAAVESIANAVAGGPVDSRFPAPSPRWSLVRLAQDMRETLRSLRSLVPALVALRRQSRQESAPVHSGRAVSKAALDQTAVEIPFAQVVLHAEQFDARAADLGETRNTLIAAFAVRLACRLGRLNARGMVSLVLPVSDRQPGDRRGNALQSVTLTTDPQISADRPQTLRDQLRAALAELGQTSAALTAMLPLIPFVPLWLARRMVHLTFGAERPVGCSLLGTLPPELNSPCGPAALVRVTSLDVFTRATLDLMQGRLALTGYSLNGQVLIAVSADAPAWSLLCAMRLAILG